MTIRRNFKMTPGKLLAELSRRGIGLLTEGDKLKISPASQLTAEDRDNIRAFKAELLSLLNVRRELEAQFGPVKPIADDHRVLLRGVSAPGFHRCEVCDDPAGLVVRGRQFCGVKCYEANDRGRSTIRDRNTSDSQARESKLLLL